MTQNRLHASGAAGSPRQHDASVAATATSWDKDPKASSSQGADADDSSVPSAAGGQLQIGMPIHVIWDDKDGGTSRWAANIVDVTPGGIQVQYTAESVVKAGRPPVRRHGYGSALHVLRRLTLPTAAAARPASAVRVGAVDRSPLHPSVRGCVQFKQL